MKRAASISIALLMVALLASPTVPQEKESGPVVAPDEITPEAQKTIDRGLAKLASMQNADGSWPHSGSAGNPGITALAALAFMAGGHQPGRGKYGANLDRAVDYVMKCTRRDGYICDGSSRMYEHGFAALFLAEVYGMTGKPELKDKLRAAVRLIESTQNPEGGWRYYPVPMDADISVTICQVMALRAARNSGIQVSKKVIDKGVEYVKKCQNPDGGFSYTAGSRGSGFERTAAGVCTLYYAGEYDSPELKKGLDYMLKNYKTSVGGRSGHFHYGHYYAVQAMFQAGGRYWADYYPAVRDVLIKQQQGDGSFSGGFGGGQAYGSAMSLIILQVPYRYLPILQR